ncbi:hypothetical protein TRSC58_00697 [Trypanosoma rangeli SC58]|uniref:Uncharacterized protein n=1 Tax=Trypanosoma rangeli SC58 TaxID=429131 RepID=A0A061J9I0_TRYRA|nr:hypothetical protein TRSC58_00697 [Trypanosoma rangeli SC58]
MRCTHAAEVEKLQAECEARQAAMEGHAVVEAVAPVGNEREALERKWKTSLTQALQEEKELQQQLVALGERHRERLAGEVAKAEAAATEQRAREEKQAEAESLAALRKLGSDMRAEVAKKKAELQQKSQAELQRLKAAAERHHQAELAAIRAMHTKRQKDRESDRNGTAVRVDEKEAVAAIEQKSKKEQAMFCAMMEATLGRLRKEICELEEEGPAPVTLGNTSSPQVDDALDKVRRHWQEEERKRMQTLEEERRNMLSCVERLQSTPSSSPSPASANSAIIAPSNTDTAVPARAVAEDLRASNEAALAVKEKSLRQTEAFLCTTLEGELARTNAPAEVQFAEAINNDLRAFVRAKELSWRLEREQFERSRDEALAEHKRAKDTYEQRVLEQRARQEEEMVQEVDQREVVKRKLWQRYADERRVLFAETDEELLEYEQKRRAEIAAQEEAKSKGVEAEMRTVAEAKQARQPPLLPLATPTLGVPMKLLQQRLSLIERDYVEQEQRLQAELDCIHAEMRRLGDAHAVKRQETPLLQAGGNLTSDISSTTAIPLDMKEQRHSSLFSSEAFHFLSEQQRGLRVRLGALHAAREEWQRDMQNARSFMPLSLQPGRKLPKLTTEEEEAVNSKLLTLVGALSDRVEALTGCVSKLRTPTGASSPQRREEHRQFRLNLHHGREKNAAGRTPTKSNKWEGVASREPHAHGTHVRQYGDVNLLQKWSHILREFATLPSSHCELSSSIQRLVTDQWRR